MGWILLGFLASVACVVIALPIHDTAREKRGAAATHNMRMRVYMREQQNQGYNYERPAKSFDPYSRMPSSSSPTGSRYGASGCGNCDQEEDKNEDRPVEPPTVQEEPEQKVTPERKPKVWSPRKSPPQVDETEDEDDTPVSKPRRKTKPAGGPTYTNFFPMMFAGSSGNGRSGEDGQNPGVLTAIANSFSTGEGAVASSRAVALGGRDSSERRSTPSRYRS